MARVLCNLVVTKRRSDKGNYETAAKVDNEPEEAFYFRQTQRRAEVTIGLGLRKGLAGKTIELVTQETENLCEFSCPKCEKTCSSWYAMSHHFRGSGHVKLNDCNGILEWATKIVLHRCRMCNRIMVCDRKVIHSHVSQRHNLSLLQYECGIRKKRELRDDFEDDDLCIPTYEAQRSVIVSPGVVPKDKVTKHLGNLCVFSCPRCEREYFSWKVLWNHCNTVHKTHLKYDPRIVKIARFHQCLLCPVVLLCDNYVLRNHVRFKHKQLTFKEYQESVAEKGGKVLQRKTPQRRKT